jgi:hypothetical protein
MYEFIFDTSPISSICTYQLEWTTIENLKTVKNGLLDIQSVTL